MKASFAEMYGFFAKIRALLRRYKALLQSYIALLRKKSEDKLLYGDIMMFRSDMGLFCKKNPKQTGLFYKRTHQISGSFVNGALWQKSLRKETCVCAKEPYIQNEPHISTKCPYACSIEPYISRKEPYISAKEPYIPAKELCIPAKEPSISAKWALLLWKSLLQKHLQKGSEQRKLFYTKRIRKIGPFGKDPNLLWISPLHKSPISVQKGHMTP